MLVVLPTNRRKHRDSQLFESDEVFEFYKKTLQFKTMMLMKVSFVEKHFIIENYGWLVTEKLWLTHHWKITID